MPVGAFLARIEKIQPDWLENEFRHSVISFGGGALLSAVALVLVPDGIEKLDVSASLVCFFLGAIGVLVLDIFLSKRESDAGQLVAMLTDFVPESIALGAAFSVGSSSGGVLALMIALQNLPEGFNAYRELRSGTQIQPRVALASFVGMAFLGPLAGLVGYFILSEQPQALAAIEMGAAGAILYLVFKDIAPKANLEKSWAPPFGAVVGFALGLTGHILAHGG